MFKKLLLPLDRSSLAEQAIGQAAAIARAADAGIDVILVHQALPVEGFTDAPWNAEQWNDEHKYIEAIAGEITSGASVPATHAMLSGETIDMICKRVKDVDADLIVMTSHGRTGLSRMWLGSVADGVIRQSAVPVLMLRPVERRGRWDAAHHLFKHVLVPLDGSAFAEEILPSAVAVAQACGARITLLSVVQPVPLIIADAYMPFAYPPAIEDEEATSHVVDDVTEQLRGMAARLAKTAGTDVHAEVVVSTRVAQSILDFARGHEVDLIAASTHGRGASRLLLGSVSDKLLRASGVPMLLQRPVGVAAEPVPIDAPHPANVVAVPA